MAYGDRRIQLFSDTFDSSISASWTQGHGDWVEWEWATGGYIQPVTTETDAGMYRNNAGAGNNQYITATVGPPAGGTTNYWELYVRSSTGSNENCYACGWDNYDSGFGYTIWEVDSAFSWTNLAGAATGNVFGSGDTLSLEVVGTTIRAGSDEGSGDAQRLVTSDATLSSGYLGIACWGDKTELRFTSVAGGNIGGNAPFKMDLFEEVSDPTLDNHTSDVGSSWQGSRADQLGIETSTSSVEVLSGSYVGAIGDESTTTDVIVECEGTLGGTNGADLMAVIARADDGASYYFYSSDFYQFRMTGVGWMFIRYDAGSGTNIVYNLSYIAQEGLDADDPIRLKLTLFGNTSATVNYKLEVDYNKDDAGFTGYTTVGSGVDTSGLTAAGGVGINMNSANPRISWFEATELNVHYATGAPSMLLPTAAGVAHSENDNTIKVDGFIESSNTGLENHTSNTGGGWQGAFDTYFLVYAAQSAVRDEISSYRTVIGDEDPSSADYFVEIEAKLGNLTGTQIAPMLRAAGGASHTYATHSFYQLIVQGNAGWRFERAISGGASLVNSEEDQTWVADNGLDVDDPIRIKVELWGTGAAVSYRLYLDFNKDDAGWGGYQLVGSGADTHANRITAAGNAGLAMAGTAPEALYFNAEELIVHTADGAPSVPLPTASGLAHIENADTIKLDTFSESGDTGLENHTSNTGGDWQGVHDTEFDVFAATDSVGFDSATNRTVIGDEDPSDADYFAECEGTLGALGNTDAIGVVVRGGGTTGHTYSPTIDFYFLKIDGDQGWKLSRISGGSSWLLASDNSYISSQGIDADDPIRLKLEVFGTDPGVRLRVYVDQNVDGGGFSGYSIKNRTYDTNVDRVKDADNVGIFMDRTNARITYFNSEYLTDFEYGSGAPSVFLPTAAGVAKVEKTATGAPSMLLPTAAGEAYVWNTSTFKADTFNETGDTPLENHSSNVGGDWQGDKVTAATVIAATNHVELDLQSGTIIGDEDPSSGDYFVEVEGTLGGVAGIGDRIGAETRCSEGALHDNQSEHYQLRCRGDTGWQLFRFKVGGSGLAIASDLSWTGDNGLDADDPIRLKLAVYGSDPGVAFKVWVDFNKDDAGFGGYQLVAEGIDTGADRVTGAGNAGFHLGSTTAQITYFNAEYLADFEYGVSGSAAVAPAFIRQPWNRQPPAGTQIDRNPHRLGRKVVSAVSFTEASGVRDLMGNIDCAVSGAPAKEIGPFGQQRRFVEGNSDYAVIPAREDFNFGNDGFTILTLFSVDEINGDDTFVSKRHATGNWNTYRVSSEEAFPDTNWQLQIGSETSSQFPEWESPDLTILTPYAIAAGWSMVAGDATDCSIAMDGEIVSAGFKANGYTNGFVWDDDATRGVHLGRMDAGTPHDYLDGTMALVVHFRGRLSDHDLASVTRDPWQLFKPTTIFTARPYGSSSTRLPTAAGAGTVTPATTVVITSVSGDDDWDDGDTGIPVVGTGMAG